MSNQSNKLGFMKSLYFHSLPLLHFPQFCAPLPRPPLTFASHPSQWHLPVAVTTSGDETSAFRSARGSEGQNYPRAAPDLWKTDAVSQCGHLGCLPFTRGPTWDGTHSWSHVFSVLFSSSSAVLSLARLPYLSLPPGSLWCPVSTVKKLSDVGHPNPFLTHFPGNLGWSPGTLLSSHASLVLSSPSPTTPLKTLFFKLRGLISPLPSVMNPWMLLCTHWGLWHLELSHTPPVLLGELDSLPTDLSRSHVVPLSSLLLWLFRPLYHMTWLPRSFLESRTLVLRASHLWPQPSISASLLLCNSHEDVLISL